MDTLDRTIEMDRRVKVWSPAEEREREAARRKAAAKARVEEKERAVADLRRLRDFPSQVTPEEIQAAAIAALKVIGKRGSPLLDGQASIEET